MRRQAEKSKLCETVKCEMLQQTQETVSCLKEDLKWKDMAGDEVTRVGKSQVMKGLVSVYLYFILCTRGVCRIKMTVTKIPCLYG